MSDTSAAIPAGVASWRDFVTLMKPRVMSLVVFTAAAGILVAPGTIHPVLAVASILCIALGAGASGALKGDKSTYQLDPANADAALQLVARDLGEGADRKREERNHCREAMGVQEEEEGAVHAGADRLYVPGRHGAE